LPRGSHRPGCDVDDCDRAHEAKGYCAKHYLNLRRRGKLGARKPCKYVTCSRPDFCRGYCEMHYQRLLNGAPLHRGKADPFRKITMHTMHQRLRQVWGPAKRYACIECGGRAAHWAYDGTDPTQHYGIANAGKSSYGWYSIYPEFYMPMYAKCHNRRDSAKAQQELREYRTFKYETGLTLEEFFHLTNEAEIDRLSSEAEL
jgi:hypothetical protein